MTGNLKVLVFSVLFLPFTMSACPDTWIGLDGRCYKTSTSPMNWFASEQWCAENGGYLAEITSEDEQVSLFSILPTDLYHFIGLADFALEGTWVWQNNFDAADYTNWEPNEPDSGLGQFEEDCVHMRPGTLLWNDASCDSTNDGVTNYHALCEADSI